MATFGQGVSQENSLETDMTRLGSRGRGELKAATFGNESVGHELPPSRYKTDEMEGRL